MRTRQVVVIKYQFERERMRAATCAGDELNPAMVGEPIYEALFTLEQSSAVEVRGMLTLPAPPVQKRTDWLILMRAA